jgi:hypothetical protein
MAQVYPLDAVVRRVDKNFTPRAVGEKIVVIDPEKRKVASGGLTDFWRDLRYFLVSNSQSQRAAESQTPVIGIRDFANNRTVPIVVSYVASCEPGNENKVALSLFDGQHPGAVLNEFISRWVKEYIGQKPSEFIENYFDRKSELSNYIIERALDEVGLSLQVIIRLDAKIPRVFVIGPLHLPVRPGGYEKEQDLKLHVELHVDEVNEIQAVLYQSRIATLERLVREQVRDYFAERVAFHRFCTELQADDIKASLSAYLDEALKPTGRKVGVISIEAQIPGLPPPLYDAQKSIMYELQEYPEQVAIKNTLQMRVHDYAFYFKSGAKPLDAWLEEKLGEAIRLALFGKKYTDLLLKFDAIETEIKDKLTAAAQGIGYGIKQLIVLPDLKEYTLLKKFPLEIEGNFRTKDSTYPANLSVVVTARIKKLLDVEKYINSGRDVQIWMKDSIIKKIQETLRTIEPERFYMRFSDTDKEGETPVEQLLVNEITQELVKEYKAEVISVIPTMGRSDITDVWDQLQKKSSDFKVEMTSLNPEDQEPVIVDGKFSIEAIHHKGWDRFSRRLPQIQEIKEYLEESLESKLDVARSHLLVYRDIPGKRDLESLIEASARESVLEEFGLVVKVKNVKRLRTASEKGLQELKGLSIKASLKSAQAALEDELEVVITANKSRKDKLIELENLRLEMVQANAPEAEIKTIERAINTVRDELRNSQIPPLSDVKQLYAKPESEPLRLSDFIKSKRHKGELSNGGEDTGKEERK